MLPRRFQKLKATLARRQPDLTVLMENVHKPHNLAAILRTCDAVGILDVHGVWEFQEELELPENFPKTARGSQKWVYLQQHRETAGAIAQLQSQGFQVCAANLSDRAIDFRRVDYTRPTALLLGAERWGVRPKSAACADFEIIIPMLGMAQSLNVSVAAAIVLYEAQRQRLEAGLYERERLPPDRARNVLFEWAYPDLAQRCRDRGLPYLPLDNEGQLLERADYLFQD
ncbi:MAG: tRNA (guanosine(18)-2'-O)-methyltransferase TrmH [Cyanobacteria bacterium J06641_5]